MHIRTVAEFFQEVDSLLTDKVDVYFTGGTALLFWKLSPSSNDLDFFVEGRQYTMFVRAYNQIKDKYDFDVDILTDRWADKNRYPRNYRSLAKRIRRGRSMFRHIRLYTVSPYDYLAAKICRWTTKDKLDSQKVLQNMHVYRHKLEARLKKFGKHNPKTVQQNYKEFEQAFEDLLHEKWSLFG